MQREHVRHQQFDVKILQILMSKELFFLPTSCCEEEHLVPSFLGLHKSVPLLAVNFNLDKFISQSQLLCRLRTIYNEIFLVICANLTVCDLDVQFSIKV